ncbi:TPA: protein phosphatase 2C domain-containing protein [Pseudomonas aeruginosa]|nr:protein phosphatase 2C domain-containing protein [Pseudomonas aeruginosa]
MSWEYVSASVAGTSHIEADIPCQDRCVASITYQDSRPWLAIFVADGAGSAGCAEQGAEMAIEAAQAYFDALMHEPEFGLSDLLAVEFIKTIRERIYSAAAAEGKTARDFACTFLGLISSDLGTLTFQVGDGGIVLDVGNGLELAIPPMGGEYANMTYFVTDEDAIDHLETKPFAGHVERAAVFSDGVQRLAINLVDQTPHEPFFAPFFGVLATIDEAKRSQLEPALVRFLSSEQVNRRTDDDKSMVVAVWRG